MATAHHGAQPHERYPIVLGEQDGRWTAWVGIHEADSQDGLMEWLRANVPIEWTGVGVGWASPPPRAPRRG